MRKICALVVAIAALCAVAANAIAAAPSVTISTSRPDVVYGGSVVLSGKLADHMAGETVTVLGEPYGSTSFSTLGTVTTSTGGKWSDTVKPTIETTYQASWSNSTSSTVTVKVRPMVALSLVNLASGTFSVKVTAARAFAGKFVLVQRLTTSGSTTIKKVTLDASSSATFSVRLHHGRNRLRAVMPSSQTSPGYITGTSNILTETR